MRRQVLTAAKFSMGIAAGFALSHLVSHPSGRARKHVPLIRIKNLQVTPNLLIATKNKKWHIHHWAYLPTLYAPFVLLVRPLLKRYWLHGLIVGSMIHGLTFQDRFTFTH